MATNSKAESSKKLLTLADFNDDEPLKPANTIGGHIKNINSAIQLISPSKISSGPPKQFLDFQEDVLILPDPRRLSNKNEISMRSSFNFSRLRT